MIGALVIVFVLIVALPVFYLLGGALLSAVLGWALTGNAEATHEGSELIELNR